MSVRQKKITEVYANYQLIMDKNNPSYVGWTSLEAQTSRWDQLLRYVQENDRVLDFGCGVGDLSEYTKLSIDYFGVDINSKYISDAKLKHPSSKFKLISGHQDVNETFEWVLCSGVFSTATKLNHLLDMVDHFVRIAKIGVAFNLLKELETFVGEKFNTWNVNEIVSKLQERFDGYDIFSVDNYSPENDDNTIYIVR